MENGSQFEELENAVVRICSEDADSSDPEGLVRLIAKRTAMLNPILKRAALYPSTEVSEDLKQEARLARSLIERLHCARIDLADDLTRLERLRRSPSRGVDAVG